MSHHSHTKDTNNATSLPREPEGNFSTILSLWHFGKHTDNSRLVFSSNNHLIFVIEFKDSGEK